MQRGRKPAGNRDEPQFRCAGRQKENRERYDEAYGDDDQKEIDHEIANEIGPVETDEGADASHAEYQQSGHDQQRPKGGRLHATAHRAGCADFQAQQHSLRVLPIKPFQTGTDNEKNDDVDYCAQGLVRRHAGTPDACHLRREHGKCRKAGRQGRHPVGHSVEFGGEFALENDSVVGRCLRCRPCFGLTPEPIGDLGAR